ncbi:MAG: DegV family EDD domain-containing protein [candidate division KSB1 bacterium]|nr:DegV family EDD domain-containing protein [candidate division KSB1 bacterium]
MPIKIRYLDGQRLRRAILAGSHFVIRAQRDLNAINVFPVADADTGTNMASTMRQVAEAAEGCEGCSISDVGKLVAESALNGARGNSGAILAQFFEGLREELEGKLRVSARAFGRAALRAAERARQAIANPREGTIITVMRDWATHFHRQSEQKSDFAELLRDSLTEARRSLAETPKKLDVLARAGVVDAGAQGFVHLLEGIVDFIETGRVRGAALRRRIAARLQLPRAEGTERPTYRYCTECVLSGSRVGRWRLTSTLGPLGDSLIVAGRRAKLRVHLHTDEPQKVLELLARYGELSAVKIDDMHAQHRKAKIRLRRKGIGIVTDSSCDLPAGFAQRHQIAMVPLTVRFGDTAYLDKVELGPDGFYERLLSSELHPTTSQPAPGDFLRAYRQALERHESVIAVHLSGALSGTLQAARTAAQQCPSDRLFVIDGKSASIALGLIVQEAVAAVRRGLSVEEVVERVRRAADNVRIWVAVPTLRYLRRSGRVSWLKGGLGTLFGIKPVLTLDEQGAASEVARTFGEKAARRKVLQLALAHARRFADPKFAVAHSHAPHLGQWLATRIEAATGQQGIWVLDASPVLGAHVGPGAAAVAVLGMEPATRRT